MAVTTHGASLVLQNRFDPVEGLALIEKHHCTALYSTPNIAQSLFDTTAAATFNLGSLRRGLSLPAGIAAMVALGARDACSIYGLSECYGNSTVSHFSDALEVRQRTCGSVLPNTELVIADPLTHQPVVAGETGEIKIKGYVTPGYYNAPALTASAFDDDGYFLTGDLGMLDIQGNLHFKGRLKEIVKSGGINISPAEVEDLLLTHEHVQQALVVGVADAVLEQALVAVVVLTSDDAVSDEDLKEFCRGRAASYKVPRRFVRMKLSDIPLTASGKYDKVTLASLL
jgi:fatty-acyl-CoA synthase